ncbi:MAG: SusC/RagA family TonB-linked outer membrane protein [Lewinellaceae bacterium]|nr:SusC/RagA family TonB-linked outer membrane protein [Lewinella sp.]MCB9282358.1 SusC/RagA family TonB-linked outer membrane protein [Lewinellaceae bacterium]
MKSRFYRRFLHSLLLVTVFSSFAFAQGRTITGTVTDADGLALPGVNVILKGTGTGSVTDLDGKYSIAVSGDQSVLTFSYIGYSDIDITVGSRSVVDVNMNSDAQVLSEVVVTALGIKRNSRALQSSVTQVDGSNFTQARENSLANALAGRVAGVNVTKIASGPAGSSRVVIRGAKTLGSNLNQPLYVVDGVPMTNNNYGQAGLWGGSDNGDGISSLNPDDIESTTVLKGASAAALYGSRAANGVILITTKKGTARKGIGVEFNSNFVFEKVNNLTDLQTTHGSGGMVGTNLQNSVATKSNSAADLERAWNGGWFRQAWGPKFDGSNVYQWDGVSRPYSYQGDQWDRFYETGTAWTNSIAFSGGNETQNFRFGMTDLRSKSVMPNAGYDRLNLSLATNSKFGKKITLESTILYSNEDTKNRPYVSDSPGNAPQTVFLIPGDVNVETYKGDPDKLGAVPSVERQKEMGITIFDGKAPGEEMQESSNLWGQNPYWAAYQYVHSDKRDRVIANGRLRYDITDFLYLQGRAGMDWSTARGTNLTPQGTGYQRGGSMTENETRIREVNMEYLVGFDKAFGSVNVNAFFGGNRMRSSWEQISANGNNFNVPFFAAINNAKDRNYGYGFAESGINSIFSNLELAYNEYLFLTGTWRRDWFSVLNPDKNSIDYPSIGASFVFTDAFKVPSWLSFGKLRAAYGEVGNANSVGAYSTVLTYSLSGSPHNGTAFASIAGNTNGSNLPNPGLVPFTSGELEFGFDVRFFNNRLGVDFSYYSQKTTDDILNAGISRASGFATTSVNLGEITNKGIELLVNGTPVRGPLNWNISLNFAKNKNEVVSLIEGQDRLFVEEPRTRLAAVYHVVGQPYGVILGVKQTVAPNGQLVYDADGAPVTDGTYQYLGNGVPDFTGGVNNDFSFKNFDLSFLIDFKGGGDIYSGTNVRLTQAGFHQQTLQGREGEAPLSVSGVTQTGTDGSGNPIYEPFTKTLTPGEAQNYWSQLGNRAQENFMYDASFIKLRQITFGYTFPRTMLEKTPFRSLSLSFVGRNLAILMKNTDNIDPESSYTSSNAQGLDYFGMPATRTYGFNLRATF